MRICGGTGSKGGNMAAAERRPSVADQTVRREAAAWLARRQAAPLTVPEQADFSEWLARDPRHGQVFAALESSWRAFDALAAYPHTPDAAPDPDLFAPVRPRRRPAAVIAASFAIAAAAVFAAFLWLQPPAPEAAGTVASTPRFTVLPDGSEVELNTGAELVEQFTGAERRVRLAAGEAHFTVTRNPERPFVVEAGGASVRAIGTAFNVKLLPAALEVLVTEGVVEVATTGRGEAAAPLRLVAGERLALASDRPDAPAPIEKPSAAEIERRLAWQGRRLVFDGLPLSEVVARINRHSERTPGAPRLVVGDAAVGQMRISGRIRASNLKSFVDIAESSFGIAAERRGHEIVLRSRR